MMALFDRLPRRCASTSVVLVLSAFGFASIAQGATFAMTGDMQLFQPSVGFNNPSREKTVPSANRGSATVTQTGMFGGVPRTLRIGAGVWQIDGWPNQTTGGGPAYGSKFRSFPQLPSFAQVSTTFLTSHGPVTFMAQSGAGAVDYCPYVAACGNYVNPLAAYPMRLAITPGARQFGGTFKLLTNGLGSVWAVPGYANTTLTMLFIPNPLGETWGPGQTNYVQQSNTRMSAFVYVNTANCNMPASPGYPCGSVTAVGSPESPPYGRIGQLGFALGPATTMGVTIDLPDYITTVFKMTTGMIRFSDKTPGSPEINTISGSDTRSAQGNGNITLVGGAMVHGGSSGNLFFNATRVHMALPEPGLEIGLPMSIAALFALQALRRRR